MTPRLRAIVVAEGRLLGQWRDELTCGAPGRGLPPLAPNLEVLVLDESRPVAAQVRAFDRALGERPGAVLVANSLLDRYPADLQVIPWHLLIADEALQVRQPRHRGPPGAPPRPLRVRRRLLAAHRHPTGQERRGPRRARRARARRRGDEITERLNTREAGDLMDEINAHRLRVNYGPHLVRVTRQDMQAWMPQVRPAQPIALDPDPALAELLQAIRHGGREAYRRLLEVLRELKTLEAGSALFKQALAELSRAQGVVLGNVGMFVDASVDPETLTRSQAALAHALVRQGLVAEAMRGGGDGQPLLRGVDRPDARRRRRRRAGDRVRRARLVPAPARPHPARPPRRRGARRRRRHQPRGVRDAQAALHRRRVPRPLPLRVGQEGHNLQNASVLTHLDLPWVPSGLEQRVGRAARPGSARGWVQTYIPYIRGAGVEHIVSILAPRGAEHHAILDCFDGVAANESTIATQLGAISGQVADHKHDAGYQATAARLRVAASVFGA